MQHMVIHYQAGQCNSAHMCLKLLIMRHAAPGGTIEYIEAYNRALNISISLQRNMNCNSVVAKKVVVVVPSLASTGQTHENDSSSGWLECAVMANITRSACTPETAM